MTPLSGLVMVLLGAGGAFCLLWALLLQVRVVSGSRRLPHSRVASVLGGVGSLAYAGAVLASYRTARGVLLGVAGTCLLLAATAVEARRHRIVE